jgi:hypothetical protein
MKFFFNFVIFLFPSIQPPRIGGVKVYTENIRDQIMMDIEVLYVYDHHISS